MTVFDSFCHCYFFQRLYKSDLFWGVRIVGHPTKEAVLFLDRCGFQRIRPTQIKTETFIYLTGVKTCSEVDQQIEKYESEKKLKKHKTN